MPEIEDIREAVGKIGLGEATIQQFGSDQAVSLRTALPEGDQAAAERAGQQLRDGIRKAFPTEPAGQGETGSGKASEELLRREDNSHGWKEGGQKFISWGLPH